MKQHSRHPGSVRGIDRRQFCAGMASAAGAVCLARASHSDDSTSFRLKYILGSCMYGYTQLAEVIPEVKKTGAIAVDIWPKVHGSQREQLDEMGEESFRDLLSQHHVQLGCITQYKLGPFGLRDELYLAQRFGCQTIVTGGRGPVGLTGQELKVAVGKFIEKMKPHLEIAAETDVVIAIENHGNNLIDSPDALKWLVELRPSKHLGIALAPYHLPQDTQQLSNLIRDVGHGISTFYAWQHGRGCMKKLPKHEELLQMPGRGDLDFTPLLAALRDVNYQGWTEIFMHPFPRGIPILDTTQQVTAEINRARGYLSQCLAAL